MTQIIPLEKELTPTQVKACAALLEGCSISEAGTRAGIGEKAVDRYLKIPSFQKLLNEGKRAGFAVATNKLARGSSQAVDTLLEIMNDLDVSPSVRVRASEAILSNAVKLSEMADLADRLSAIEIEIALYE